MFGNSRTGENLDKIFQPFLDLLEHEGVHQPKYIYCDDLALNDPECNKANAT